MSPQAEQRSKLVLVSIALPIAALVARMYVQDVERQMLIHLVAIYTYLGFIFKELLTQSKTEDDKKRGIERELQQVAASLLEVKQHLKIGPQVCSFGRKSELYPAMKAAALKAKETIRLTYFHPLAPTETRPHEAELAYHEVIKQRIEANDGIEVTRVIGLRATDSAAKKKWAEEQKEAAAKYSDRYNVIILKLEPGAVEPLNLAIFDEIIFVIDISRGNIPDGPRDIHFHSAGAEQLFSQYYTSVILGKHTENGHVNSNGSTSP